MPLSEWEYMPCVGPRPPAGLVGLKNAGATCYMNSVLQQLYCVRAVRDALLTVQGYYYSSLQICCNTMFVVCFNIQQYQIGTYTTNNLT